MRSAEGRNPRAVCRDSAGAAQGTGDDPVRAGARGWRVGQDRAPCVTSSSPAAAAASASASRCGCATPAIARSPSPARTSDEFAAAQQGKPSPLPFWPCDLADIDALRGLVKAIRADVGPIYGLVNNAGIGTSGMLANMRTREIERLVRLNTVSPMVLTKHVVRAMMADGAAAAASSTSRRSSPPPGSAGCRSTPRPRPRSSASPSRWRARSGRSASPSTRWRRALSTPR